MKYIVELRKIDYSTVHVEAENRIQAAEEALKMTENLDAIDWGMDEICPVGVCPAHEVMQ